MPKWNRRRTQSAGIIKKRWSIEKFSPNDSSDDDEMEVDSKRHDFKDDVAIIDWTNTNMLNYIGDLFQICNETCNLRSLSTLLYMTLKHFNIIWRDIDNFLSSVGGMRCITAQKWAEIFVTEDLETFIKHDRGGKQGDLFCDIYPELETAAKSFALEACGRKSADFKTSELAGFVDSEYYKLTNTEKLTDKLIRSVEMCRLDLKRWGCKFEANTQRPYFEGHDRIDVLSYREKFLDYFLSKKSNYYLLGAGDQPLWCVPVKEPRILMCN